MSRTSGWAKACDHLMPNVCRPALANQPRAERDAELKGNVPQDIHKERWAEYEKHGKQPAPAPTKVRVALRIGVFFDGTGNNASNTASGRLCGAQHPIKPADLDASCKPYMSDPDSSYGNDLTNVKKLSELYHAPPELEGEGQQKLAYRKVYVDGIGTVAGEQDNLVGSGFGRGETGVAERVWTAFKHIKGEVQRLLQNNPDTEISSLTFDTFGFSRGAAAARHFANQLLLGNRGPLREVIQGGGKAFGAFFVEQFQADIQIGFIGLFDTVAAVAGLSNLGNIRTAVAPGLKLHLSPRYFPRVVQLAARDECRDNFPLSQVKPDHPEIALPGVHSDIGGGYLAEAQECVLVSPMQALDVSLHTDVKTTAIYRDALQAQAQWLEKGWPAAMLEIVTPEARLLPADSQDRNAPRQKRVYAALQLKRQVRGELSRVYLRVMYELAKQKGVRFGVIDEHDPDYSIPPELQSLCDHFVAGDYSTTAAEEALLRLKYIHTSANWNPPARLQGETPRTGARVKFINAPTADAVRVLHPHIEDWKL